MKEMKNHKGWLILTVVLLMALLGSLAACSTAPQPITAPLPAKAQGERPVINSFSAAASTISSGQGTELSWNISGSGSVVIDQGIGNVNLTGKQQVSPSTTTTYTLTATSGAENIVSSQTIVVTPAVTTFPDLVVVEIPNPASSVVSYKIKNVGTATSLGSWSKLYVNDDMVAVNYVQPLAPGEERVESFTTYRTNLTGPAETSSNPTKAAVTKARVCSDAENTATEINENNNCKEVAWGVLLAYNFVESAQIAEWGNGTSMLRWPMSNLDDKGSAFFNRSRLEDNGVYSDGLAMYPQHVSQGMIKGTFAYPAFDNPTQLELMGAIIPAHAKFTAKVGFAKEASSPQGAMATFALVDPDSGTAMYSKTVDIYYDGKLDSFNVDLNAFAGKEAYFALKVESKGDGTKDFVVWIQPQIVQGQPQ